MAQFAVSLMVGAGMDSGADIAFWNTQMHLILEEVEGKTVEQAATTTPLAAPPGQKACRLGPIHGGL